MGPRRLKTSRDRLAERADAQARADLELRVERFAMLDTGIGRELGFADDKAFLEAMDRRRTALPAWQRELEDAIAHDLDQAFLYGRRP